MSFKREGGGDKDKGNKKEKSRKRKTTLKCFFDQTKPLRGLRDVGRVHVLQKKVCAQI